MTREEAYNRIDVIIARHEIDNDYVTITSILDYDALRMARKALEKDSKTGRWKPTIVRGSKSYICSECSDECCYVTTNYCPSCGAKMIEPQERSEE